MALQLLLHSGSKGVSRAELIEALYDDREVRDAAHSLHVLFYNLRKKLQQTPLPKLDYVLRQGELYYWTLSFRCWRMLLSSSSCAPRPLPQLLHRHGFLCISKPAGATVVNF